MKITFKILKFALFFIVFIWLGNHKINAQIVQGKYYHEAETVGNYYEMYADSTFKLEVFGCLGKFFEGCGVWEQLADTVYLTLENRQREKFIMVNDDFYPVYKSENKLDSNNYNFLTDYEFYNSFSKLECKEKHYIDGKIQVKYSKSNDLNTLIKIGYYHSGKIEYIQNFDKSHKPVGISYYFSEDGNIVKTIDYLIKKEPKISKRELRKMRKIQMEFKIP